MIKALTAITLTVALSGCAAIPTPKPSACQTIKMTAEERADVARQVIYVGMREDLLLCSWGYADYVNRASYGNQYVYRTMGKSSYVYTRNGVVTSWQK